MILLKLVCTIMLFQFFLAAEGIELTALEVTNIVNTYDALGRERLPSKKVQSLIAAKKMGQEDESLPCPV